jgi:catechol 2,3-dioxygenase-like lactoylglutathione lyase family enzyme
MRKRIHHWTSNTWNAAVCGREFRFAYFTPVYEETISFFHDGLGMPILEAWDRSPDDRGVLIGAGSGMIEVLTVPSGASDHFFDRRPPQGAFIVIEVDEIEELYTRVRGRHLPIQQALETRSWGHRSFCAREPNGLTLYFFSSIPSSS